jgi:hypothetical protein
MQGPRGSPQDPRAALAACHRMLNVYVNHAARQAKSQIDVLATTHDSTVSNVSFGHYIMWGRRRRSALAVWMLPIPRTVNMENGPFTYSWTGPKLCMLGSDDITVETSRFGSDYTIHSARLLEHPFSDEPLDFFGPAVEFAPGFAVADQSAVERFTYEWAPELIGGLRAKAPDMRAVLEHDDYGRETGDWYWSY